MVVLNSLVTAVSEFRSVVPTVMLLLELLWGPGPAAVATTAVTAISSYSGSECICVEVRVPSLEGYMQHADGGGMDYKIFLCFCFGFNILSKCLQ